MLKRFLNLFRSDSKPRPTLLEQAFAEAQRCAGVMQRYGFKSEARLNDGGFVTFFIAAPIYGTNEANAIWGQLEPWATPLDVRQAFGQVILQLSTQLRREKEAEAA